jgi:two-component system, OmpR family, osmolarity sensor histidine kinase EnvZ
LNTLFVRTILLTMVVLLAVHAGVSLLDDGDAAGSDDSALPTAVVAGRPISGAELGSAVGTSSGASTEAYPGTYPGAFSGTPDGATAGQISLVPAALKLDLAVRPKIVDLHPAVYEMPSQSVTFSDVAAPMMPVSVDSRPDDSSWFDVPPGWPLDSRFALAEWALSVLILALAFVSLLRVQRPLRGVTHAAREVACGRRVAATVREEGPGELRRVVRAFNEMARRRNEALEAQAAALAGLAEHMEYQAARLRTRALEVNEWHKRVAFVEDIDSFSDIAQQLLEVAGRHTGADQLVSVDGFLRDRFSMIGSMDGALFACDLKAGPQFLMSRPLLERLMSNLVDNALEHGEPPIEIRTARHQDGWLLSVRDHGTGIEANDMASATQPFVRLNTTPRNMQHWGLGLAVVARLARSCGASLELGNHPNGGLWVRLVLPMR